MKTVSHMLAAVTALICLGAGATAHAGKIVVANDEWTLSDSYFAAPNDPAKFATNVTSWFNNGVTGDYLAYSTNFGLTGTNLRNAITGAGNTWTVSTASTFNLSTLSAYDGVFLAGNPVDNSVLIDYVNAGGNVYIAGGTGWGGPVAEANQWNTFLNNFGLGFGTAYNGVGGNIAINSTHPIFNGVDSLYQNNGNDALDLYSTDPKGQIILSANGHGLYAVYDSGPAPVPEPGTMMLLGIGMLGMAVYGKRRMNRET
ncbi:MAG: PEP-CTERM sorting domain-containing protein [Desulfuromonadaceae bacterium]